MKNAKLLALVTELKKAYHSQKTPLWNRLANDIMLTANRKRAVNLSRISHHSQENEIIVVPGKVLGGGLLGHKITIAACAFSGSAKEKIVKSNSKAITIKELLEQNPKGKGVRILG